MVLVTVPPPEYESAKEDAEPVQTLEETSLEVSFVS
jgi:hypothetical protein